MSPITPSTFAEESWPSPSSTNYMACVLHTGHAIRWHVHDREDLYTHRGSPRAPAHGAVLHKRSLDC